MKRTIVFRFALYYLAVAGVLICLNLLFTFTTARDSHRKTLSRSLHEFNRALIPLLEERLNSPGARALDAFLKSYHSPEDPRITVIRPDGTVAADSGADPVALDNHADRPEVRQALNGRTGESLRYSVTAGQHLLYVADPIVQGGAVKAVVRSSMYVSEIDRVMRDFMAHLARSLVLLAAATGLLGILLARRLSKPFRELKDAFARLASGDFDVRVEYPHPDEIRELVDHFNAMAENTGKLFRRLAERKDELDALVRAMPEGLCVCDESGRVVMHNEAWAKITAHAEPVGRFYWELVREAVFTDMMKDVYAGKDVGPVEVVSGGRDYYCQATRFPGGQEVLVILHDVTELREFDRRKKDFVTNVSHELRTPLTAIKGYAETISPAGDADRRYLDIIKRNTDRLIAIVNDVATLSEMEENNRENPRQPVDLNAALAGVLKIFEPRLKEKNLVLRVEAEPGLSVPGDSFKLEQLLVNLIDNAVKYTEKGEIGVRLARRDQAVAVVVRDTGVGIPAEHLNRIFERFYVVDKARSRSAGGTGLGLSIVKHIVQSHGGSINVISRPGQGTEFTVLLPV